MSLKKGFLVLVLAGATACVDGVVAPRATNIPDDASFALSPTADEIMAQMDATNAALSVKGSRIRVAKAEYVTNNGSMEAGSTLLQKDVGNKQLADDFVARDPRRVDWSGAPGLTDDVTYSIDQTGDALPTGGVTSAADATAAIRRAMASWQNLACSTLPIAENSAGAIDVGFVAFLLSGGAIGSDIITGDVQHAGFRDLNFGAGVLAATFTFVFVDDNGNPTDIDGNRRADVAFREIYYDPSWIWRINADIDVESIALHEAGHGLSQAHFGNIVLKNSGAFDVNPRAVMNAVYQAPFQSLVGPDIGGHCSNWAAWPNK